MEIVFNVIKIVLLIIVTFLLCRIITNKKRRLSILGTFLIVCSTAIVQYINLGLVEVLFFGELFLIFLNKFLFLDKSKYLYCLGMSVSIIGYLLCTNLSFQISVGIAILTIVIWLLIKYFNKKTENKIKMNEWGFLVFVLIISVVISVIFYRYIVLKKLDNQNGLAYVLNYTYSVMLPFNKNIKFNDITCLATMISVFPTALVIAIIYVFKYENKHLDFFMPTIIVTLIDLMLLISGAISFLVPNYILAIGFALIQIYMMIYIFANVEEKIFGMIKNAYLSLAGIIPICLVPFPDELITVDSRAFPYMIFVLESFILLNYTDKRFWILASWIYILLTILETIGFIIVKIV